MKKTHIAYGAVSVCRFAVVQYVIDVYNTLLATTTAAGFADNDEMNSLVTNIRFISGYVRPFVLDFHTDANEQSNTPATQQDSGNRGFCLDYVQLPCQATGAGGK